MYRLIAPIVIAVLVFWYFSLKQKECPKGYIGINQGVYTACVIGKWQ